MVLKLYSISHKIKSYLYPQCRHYELPSRYPPPRGQFPEGAEGGGGWLLLLPAAVFLPWFSLNPNWLYFTTKNSTPEKSRPRNPANRNESRKPRETIGWTLYVPMCHVGTPAACRRWFRVPNSDIDDAPAAPSASALSSWLIKPYNQHKLSTPRPIKRCHFFDIITLLYCLANWQTFAN